MKYLKMPLGHRRASSNVNETFEPKKETMWKNESRNVFIKVTSKTGDEAGDGHVTSSGGRFDSNCRNLWMTCYTEGFYFERGTEKSCSLNQKKTTEPFEFVS